MNEQDTQQFDFESYVNNYSGRTRFQRAQFIAQHCPRLEIQVLEWAINEIKQTSQDVKAYQACVEQLNTALSNRGRPAVPVDESWVVNTEQRAKATKENLENDVRANKVIVSKEQIRNSMRRLADQYYDMGDLQQALRHYVRTRDYCSTSEHVIDMCFDVIQVSLEMKNESQLATYIARADTTPNVPNKDLVRSKLECCRALAALRNQEAQEPEEIYSAVANALTNVSFEMNQQFNHIMSANDVAIYGGLCALAAFDRATLRTKVMTNSAFKSYLELEPRVRDMVDAFYDAKYTACLSLLQNYSNNLKLDIYLEPHVHRLVALIRRKAIIQYCAPYSTVDLHRMASAFDIDVAKLQTELAELISRNDNMNCRIDSHNKILRAKQRDQRHQTLKQSLEAGDEYEKNTKALMLRMKLLKADMVVR